VSASSLRQITRALESTPIERYSRAHQRAFELWCHHAPKDEALSLDTERDVGADRFSILIQLLKKNGRGDRASLLRHAWMNNSWPSTGVWVAEQLHNDARKFIREVIRVGEERALEWILIPFLGLGEITGLRDPLLDAVDDIPDATLKRLVVHARDDFGPLWKDRHRRK
jgi:hypothetical protein